MVHNEMMMMIMLELFEIDLFELVESYIEDHNYIQYDLFHQLKEYNLIIFWYFHKNKSFATCNRNQMSIL